MKTLMMWKSPTCLSLAVLALLQMPLARAAQTSQATQATQPADEPWALEARSVATSVPPKLLQVLTDAIAKSSAADAVTLCQDAAPKMARAASDQTGWQVRRVSLRHRNPKAVPDAWEHETLQEFDRRAAAGEPLPSLERATVQTVDGRTVQRYMRALPTQGLCLSCHGAVEQLAPGVAERLKVLYPDDRALGYGLGQIRGAMTLKRSL